MLTDLLRRGFAEHQAGRLREAEAAYRQVLAADPGNSDALNFLGVMAIQIGRNDQAVEILRQALLSRPQFPEALANLGGALRVLGRLAEAEAKCREALRLQPNLPEAHVNLGNVLYQNSRLEAAEASYREALRLRVDDAVTHNNLGNVLRDLRQFDAAEAHYREALRRDQNYAAAHNNLGNVLRDAGRPAEAEQCYREALRLLPDYPQAHLNLGNVLNDLGRGVEAEVSYREALRLRPSYPEAYNNLGNVLRERGLLVEAEQHYLSALRLRPDFVEPHTNLGHLLTNVGRVSEAESHCREALRLRPDFADAHGNLGNCFMAAGRAMEAEACFREALRLRPDHPWVSDNLLLSLNYREGFGGGDVLAAHRDWGDRHGGVRRVWSGGSGGVGGRLRVGYVSPDLREHSVAYFLSALLCGHDRARFEPICYALPSRRDGMSERLRELSAGWVELGSGPSEVLAERIAADGVDILVDLSGHTAGSRLDIFAHKPAAVQISWLGYPNTTGLAAIDYRITDGIADPAGEDSYYTERLLRLDRCFVCYRPREDAPTVAGPPGSAGRVTFGSFNTLAKLGPGTIGLWAQVLRGVPGSRLYLKAGALADGSVCARVRDAFAAAGIEANRLRLEGWTASAQDHMALYREVDIALDPIGYNGTTTTCEAMWMGVPVLSLRGERHASRVGASLLSAVGLGELIAEEPAEYVALAASLAGDAARLKTLRAGLRERMRASALCDDTAFARALEAAFLSSLQQNIGPQAAATFAPGAR